MRNTSSCHRESTRALPLHYRRENQYPDHNTNPVYRPALNLSAFSELLQIPVVNATDASEPTGKGKKRAVSPSSTTDAQTQKRAKSSNGDATHVNGHQAPFIWAPMAYPALCAPKDPASTADVPAGAMPGHFADPSFTAWTVDEKNVEQALGLLGGPFCEPHKFDLGDAVLAQSTRGGRLVVVSKVLEKRRGAAEWLALLPVLSDGLDYGADSKSGEDIMMACVVLRDDERVAIDSRLALVMLPAKEAHSGVPFRLQIQVTVSARTPSIYKPNHNDRFFRFLRPVPVPDSFEGVTNISFLYSLLRPAPQVQSAHEALLPTLLPFQRRSVAWLLNREGKAITPNGDREFSFWEQVGSGQVFYVNRLSGLAAPDAPDEEPVLGAILAEEPGLGKTLEMISLFLLNPASNERHPGVKRWDPVAEVEVKAVKTNFSLAPHINDLARCDQIAQHAPGLKVLVYDGWAKVKVPITDTQIEEERRKRRRAATRGKGKIQRSKGSSKAKKGRSKHDSEEDSEASLDEDEAGEDVEEVVDWCAYVHTFDVVITTYQTLGKDFDVARAAPKRPRREDVVYSNVTRPRSPLILVEWNRVVMDEVQMVGGGRTEDMVSLIPRLSSFAVSGTPARTKIGDLMHVLKFLRVDHLIGSNRLWELFGRSEYAGEFSAFFRNIAIRTTKVSVKAELTIPQQTRYLVGIEMGPVERHVYEQNLETTLQQIGLDARGVAATENWEVDGTLLRSLLRRLRAICTHPQVGQLTKPGDKLFKAGALKSMEQVLQAMSDNNWNSVIDDSRTKVQGLIRTAQLQNHLDDRNRYRHSLETLLLAEKETNQLITEINSRLATHEASRQDTEPVAQAGDEAANDKGKGKERERSLSPLSELDSDDGSRPETTASKEHRAKRNAMKIRLRECRLILHRIKFLQGDAYHMLGDSQAAAEDTAYGAAETIRQSLLKATGDEAVDAMNQLAKDVSKKGLTAQLLKIEVPYLSLKLTLKDQAFEADANDIIEYVLNEQSELLWEWRARMTELLTQKLTPGEDADGQEYQRTLDDQGEAETYLRNYAALLADRREALLKERTLLAAHDTREKQMRHTKAAMKAAAALDVDPGLDGIELQPEHEVLHLDLQKQRKDLLNELDGRAIKSVVVEMGARAALIHKETDPQKILLKRGVADLRKLIADQGALLDKLEADLALYRKAFNQRILYYRQLQEISDSVADVVFDSVDAALTTCAAEHKALTAKINTNRAQQRYLDQMARNRDGGDPDEEDGTCILCKCEFVRGNGHVFCEDCMKAWVKRKEGKTCPVCRLAIDPDTLERFAVEAPELPKRPKNTEAAPKSRREITYNMINPKIFREIQTQPSFGDYGNKIQHLVRHLLYIRTSDPGAKTIVFSAWADSLFIVERALQENGIRCLRIDQNRKGEPAVKRFKSDENILGVTTAWVRAIGSPELMVMLILRYSERENAGLDITCASRVCLLEPVVHHAFEIQAIARIDRMGQMKATEDTVEKNILDLAARQGTSLYTIGNSVGSISNITSLAENGEKPIVDAPAKKNLKGDFIFKIDDMLSILFPHLSEDVEFLIDEDVAMVDAPSIQPRVNAVAGPSRLS
ncbi:SNF2 family N-terminal domain-containing protein [Mycena rebaudengoi]|nr:SNF2 family N-terminal domain-containing protein [Mycena rebaudengoi]